MPAKSAGALLNPSLSPKYRAERFQNYSCVSGDLMYPVNMKSETGRYMQFAVESQCEKQGNLRAAHSPES